MPAAVGDTAELLVILVQQRARVAGDIAHRRQGHPIGIAHAADATSLKHPVDRRGRSPEERAQPVGTIAPGRPGRPGSRLPRWRSAGVVSGAVERIDRAAPPHPPREAAQPLVGSGTTDPQLVGHLGRRPTTGHPIDDELTAEDRQLRSSMSHESPLSAWSVRHPKPSTRALSCQRCVWDYI